MKKIRLAIVGSRTFEDYDLARDVLDGVAMVSGYEYVEMVSGGARGADTIGERYADERGIPKRIFPAEWKKYGRRAGFIRNVDIIDNCDVCVCFWDGESHGTKHDIELCQEKHKPCIVHNFVNSTTKFMNYE